jgi:hypothetical protein
MTDEAIVTDSLAAIEKLDLPAEPSEPALPETVLTDPSTEAGQVALAGDLLPPSPEPVASVPSLPEAPPVAVASPVAPAAPPAAEATIRSWAADTFTNLVATGRLREREAEAFVQDLLKRLGL